MFVVKCLLLTILVLAASRSEDASSAGSDGRARTARLFSLFNVVTFNNVGCTSSATGTGTSVNRNGTCYSSSECTSRGGQAQGSCASGFGVCCVFIVTSGTTVSENCTYVQNPNFPSADTAANAITYTVSKCSSAVCTLRLDFDTFTLQGTGGTNNLLEGVCLDTFTVTVPTQQQVPVICGLNAGQHMYLDIGATAGDTATLAFAFMGTATQRLWDIKITQLECSNPSRPPNTCLQYTTGLTGRITTFNFNNAADNHLNGQQYSVCVRREAGFCCVNYNVCADQMAAGFTFDTTQAAMTDNNCLGAAGVASTVDYISIPGSAGTCNRPGSANAATSNLYCGMNLNFANQAFNTPICDCTAPFSVDIFFNNVGDVANAVNAIQSRGLCLEYSQVAC